MPVRDKPQYAGVTLTSNGAGGFRVTTKYRLLGHFTSPYPAEVFLNQCKNMTRLICEATLLGRMSLNSF